MYRLQVFLYGIHYEHEICCRAKPPEEAAKREDDGPKLSLFGAAKAFANLPVAPVAVAPSRSATLAELLYYRFRLCRTSTPSRNHCSAAYKARGHQLTQPHEQRAPRMTRAIGSMVSGNWPSPSHPLRSRLAGQHPHPMLVLGRGRFFMVEVPL